MSVSYNTLKVQNSELPLDFLNLTIQENRNVGVDISVVIPVYNAQKFIEKAIDSVIKQKTKYSYEIILVNDGSTDGSIDILKTYVNQYGFIRLVNKENGGISSARNAGIKLAIGNYIMFLDNDDYISEDYIEIMLNKAYENKADIVKCGYAHVTETGEIINQVSYLDLTLLEGLSDNVMDFDGLVWNTVFKRTIWDGVAFPEGFWYEDMITRSILFRKCKCFCCVSNILYYNVEHSKRASRVVWGIDEKRVTEQLILVEQLIKKNNESGMPLDLPLYRIVLYELSVMLFSRMKSRCSKKMKKELFLASCYILEKNRKDTFVLKKVEEREIEEAMLSQKYWLWSTLCEIENLKLQF